MMIWEIVSNTIHSFIMRINPPSPTYAWLDAAGAGKHITYSFVIIFLAELDVQNKKIFKHLIQLCITYMVEYAKSRQQAQNKMTRTH